MRTALFWCAWHAVAGAVVAVFPSLFLAQPPWTMSRAEAVQLLVLLTGYALGALVLHLLDWLRGGVDRWTASALAPVGFVPSLGLLAANGLLLPSALVVAVVLSSAGLLTLPYWTERRIHVLVAVGGASLITFVALSTSTSILRRGSGPTVTVQSVSSSLYALRASFFRGFVPRGYSGVAGGGIVDLDDGGLLITGDGDAYRYRWEQDSLEVESLAMRAPLNREALIDEVGVTDYIHWFRVFDVAARVEDGRLQIYVSHHHWRPNADCFVVRVSRLDVGDAAQLSRASTSDWTNVHETEPCLALQLETDPGWPFRGMEGGGRMAFIGPEQLLLTVGDQGFNGHDFQTDLVNDLTASYGKTVLIHLDSGEWSVFTTGHRNAQGLLVDGQQVWATEHGPQGGDELNLLSEGVHFGWPHVTYGTDYGRTVWPLSQSQGRHDLYRKPVFAWVPSIGVSALARGEGSLFPLWEGDLLAGSLVGRTLSRVRVEGDAVKVTEPITVGEPVRDLHVDSRGRIVLWTDRYSIVVITPASMRFAGCVGCHRIGDGQQHGIGPDLAGVLGRPLADAPGFSYSGALREVGGRWSVERLDRFLADPQAFAPGTTMLMEGIEDPQERQAIIRYLEQDGG